MVSFLNRKITFEVMIQKQSRWQIQAVCEQEKEALDLARKVLASGKVQAAKVVQQRTMPITGFTTSSIIFEELAPPPSEKPIVANDPKGDLVYICGSSDDFYSLPSRRMMAAVMREYLFKMQITPTELLHGWSHIKKLQDTGTIQMTSVQRAGAAQARATGTEPRDRINRLNLLVEDVAQRARYFAAERKKMLHFDGKDVSAYAIKLRDQVGPDEFTYVFRSMITAWIHDHRALPVKLDLLLGIADDDIEWPTMQELDGFIADIFSFGEVIQELFGPQNNLARFLMTLSDLLLGRPEAIVGNRNPSMALVAKGLNGGRLPQTYDALLERLIRELSADKPLDKIDPDNDVKRIDELVEHLKGPQGLLGGEKTEKALAQRRLKQRQNLLRRMGMHSVAENLRPDQV